MLRLIWYIVVGFLAGCVAKALLHTHLSIMWTIILGIVGSIIGGAVTHLFYPPSAGGRFHPGGLIVSILGAILVLFLWHKSHLHLPRGYIDAGTRPLAPNRNAQACARRNAFQLPAKLTWLRSILGWQTRSLRVPES